MSRTRSSTHARLAAALLALALLAAGAAGAAHSHGLDSAKPCAVCVVAGATMTVVAPVAVEFDPVEVGGIADSSWLPASACYPASHPSRAPPAS